MAKNNIITPEYVIVDSTDKLLKVISKFGFPIVIKNNFLQGGFGSHICTDEKSAVSIAKEIIKKYKFCIAEKFIEGFEISQQYFYDKNTLLPMLPVKDFKKMSDKITAVNTDGLACYTPVVLSEKEITLLEEYNKKLFAVLKNEQADFTGIFTSNLLFSNDKIYTFEFNMRPGISEFETLIEHLECDLLQILYKCACSKLEECNIRYKEGITGCVCVAPKTYLAQKVFKQKNILLKKNISCIDNDIKLNFCASINKKGKKLKIETNKRFLTVICTDKKTPFEKIYSYISDIDSCSFYYRKGIKYEKRHIENVE